MDIRIAEEKVYVPEFRGNKDLPKGEQVQAVMRQLTVEEKDDCYVIADGQLKPDRKKFFARCVKEIRNLKENGKEIRTAEDLLASRGLFALYIELATEALMGNVVTEEEEKNS